VTTEPKETAQTSQEN